MAAPSDATAAAVDGRPGELLALSDWRRRVFDLYRHVRAASDPAEAWRRWRATRDELLSRHPQSPLPEHERASFAGVEYFEYDPSARALATIAPIAPVTLDITTSQDSAYRFARFGKAEFELHGQSLTLELYWIEGYGGGIYLPFGDGTSGTTTYGGGRYLLDTVKGADLGAEGELLVLDFNFAYNPSCAYDPRWSCPLAPPANRLAVDIRAGERVAT
ncbi:MAG TPA: DUF1684 domain-containing protein [Thermoleophilaceae bacterium]|nr:DUF1684 domain-containing protein [Thermoleophilaceae bacterium]